MTEEEIKEMHEQARTLLQEELYLSEWARKIARNCFRKIWWGIDPEEALEIGNNKTIPSEEEK